MDHIFCIHYTDEGHLASSQLLTIKNKIAMNVVEHVSSLYIGTSFEYMPISCITGSLGITMSNLLSNHQTDIHSGCSVQQISPVRMCSRVFHTFSYICFSVSDFMWRSLIHLDLSFYKEIKIEQFAFF